jgi:hypothetical protein
VGYPFASPLELTFTISGKIPCGVPGAIATYCSGERKAAIKKV